MTAKLANKLATAMMSGVEFETRDDSARVQKILVRKLQRTSRELKRAIGRAAYECEGKKIGQMSDILIRAIRPVLETEADLIELEFI